MNFNKFLKFILKRLTFIIPQLFGISVVTFSIIRLLPGDPAKYILGFNATEKAIESLTSRMGYDKSIYEQYIIYIKNVFKGDLGTSWFTTQSVTEDLLTRAPATLELITLALFIALVIGISLGVMAAIRPNGFASKVSTIYGMVAGALPDFWIGLILLFLFYTTFHIFPAPMGRIALNIAPPERITGFFLIDSILEGNFLAFRSAFMHLVLPVLSLAVCAAPLILKMTRSTMISMLNSDFIRYGIACGLSERAIIKKALRNALPPCLTIAATIYVYYLGAAVLIESIYGWGGIGQYAVESLMNTDYVVMQGFVLVAATFTIIVWIFVDILYAILDPRVLKG